ncbi:Reticulophagy regulator 1 [Merluccius polli]|uniref:Reticulophagy regulator 1 n=1 Tax=Merluccius polli TaxID=89951 RepID=A0AA47NRX8_MERPO|nr:Reticulophagy regulator 1 [Merluccius polli]
MNLWSRLTRRYVSALLLFKEQDQQVWLRRPALIGRRAHLKYPSRGGFAADKHKLLWRRVTREAAALDRLGDPPRVPAVHPQVHPRFLILGSSSSVPHPRFLILGFILRWVCCGPKEKSLWKLMDPGESGGSETEPPLSETFRLFLQETSSFKQQNPGKFCLLVCSLCTFFAVLGRYIPGIIVSYILILGVFLWPLISSQEFGLWLKPVLQKLDFGFGEFLQKIKDNHERRLLEAASEKESIEADLSSLFPKLDSAVCKEMSVSDTEVSDVTWTDNGTFNLSEGHTPQTDNSEGTSIKRKRLPVDSQSSLRWTTARGPTETTTTTSASAFLPRPHEARRPIRSKHTSAAPPLRDPTERALELVNQMASDAIAAAVTAAIQERIEAAVGVALPADALAMSRLPECTAALLPIALAEESESDSEVEDFELLDQSELEQLDKELGLAVRSKETQEEGGPPGDKPSHEASSPGFFSKLLGRH